MTRKPGRPRSTAPKQEILSIRVPSPAMDKYRRLAAEDKRTLADWVRITLEKVTEEREP